MIQMRQLLASAYTFNLWTTFWYCSFTAVAFNTKRKWSQFCFCFIALYTQTNKYAVSQKCINFGLLQCPHSSTDLNNFPQTHKNVYPTQRVHTPHTHLTIRLLSLDWRIGPS